LYERQVDAFGIETARNAHLEVQRFGRTTYAAAISGLTIGSSVVRGRGGPGRTNSSSRSTREVGWPARIRLPALTQLALSWKEAHVEAHAASFMRQQGIDEATLYINRIPCPGKTGCDAMLSRMLPPGARLHVRGPDGFRHTYTGREG
jgi:hypothetical protein